MLPPSPDGLPAPLDGESNCCTSRAVLVALLSSMILPDDKPLGGCTKVLYALSKSDSVRKLPLLETVRTSCCESKEKPSSLKSDFLPPRRQMIDPSLPETR